MPIWDEMKAYARFASGLYDFLRHPINLEQAKSIIRQRLEARESNFLRMMERGVYGNPKSPYLPLLKLAQIELGDMRVMTETRGLESTLRALNDAGVYVTFEEFKGRKPLVRQGQEIKVTPRDFDNPFMKRHYEVKTGGSTGAGMRVSIDLNHIAANTPAQILLDHGHGMQDGPAVMWMGTLPDPTGFSVALRRAKAGRKIERWFTPLMDSQTKPEFKHRFATRFLITASRLSGFAIPAPEPVPLSDAEIVVRAIAGLLKKYGTCFVTVQVSRAVRIAVAAQEAGIDLTGALLSGGGEPPTEAKIREITKTGAKWAAGYYTVEAGALGYGCTHSEHVDDMHFLKDAFGLITMPHTMDTGETVEAFCFTSLLPTAPKLMLNMQSDDYGIIEHRNCGCIFEEVGLTDHIRQVRSFGKLTGEGVTLVGSDMIRIMEEVLPARFGGSPLDYQLVEEEDPQTHMTRVSLIVSPRITLIDEREVVEVVYDLLRNGEANTRIASHIWEQANTLQVKRMEPVWTARGKLLPLHKPKITQG